MAVTYGFYNSVNGDRKYDSDDISSMFEGIIQEGVLASVGDAFVVTPSTGTTVNVGTGRAWFNNKWTLNDTALPVILDAADSLLPRYDEIVLEINMNTSVRANSIKALKGTPGTNPIRPSKSTAGNIRQYSLAYILRPAGSTSVSAGDIHQVVGTSETPFVIGAVSSMSVDSFVAGWDDQFTTWFNNLNVILQGDVAATLASKVSTLESRFVPPAMHRTTYRGNSLGTSFSTAQKAAVNAGTFDGIFLGDYWTIGGITYRVADFDYWYGRGSIKVSKHHLVVVPDQNLYSARMNASATTATGYADSQMRTTNLASAKATINGAFPGAVLNRRDVFSKQVTNGIVTDYDAYDSTIDLMNEVMVTGAPHFESPTKFPQISNSQLALFQFAPWHIPPIGTQGYWLNSVANGGDFAGIYINGAIDWFMANDTSPGVRPAFAVVGA